MLNEIITAPFSQNFTNFLTGMVPGLKNAFLKLDSKADIITKEVVDEY
jgi:hypothetical protein